MKLFDKSHYKPILGVFYLSGIERIINSIFMLSIGAFIGSYQIDLTNKVQSMKDLSSWYVVPFIILVYWLLDPMLSLTSKVEEDKRRFSHFIVDLLWMIIIMSCLEIIYRQLLSVLVDNFQSVI